MAKKAKKKAAKPSETVTISARLDPLTRYGLELTSRAQRRSMSDVITWAIDQLAEQTPMPSRAADGLTIKKLAVETWSPNEIERIIQLGMFCPELLEFKEANIWRVIRETPELWNVPIDPDSPARFGHFRWERLERQMAEVEELVREKAEQVPVTGLSAKQVMALGWDIDDERSDMDVPF